MLQNLARIFDALVRAMVNSSLIQIELLVIEFAVKFDAS